MKQRKRVKTFVVVVVVVVVVGGVVVVVVVVDNIGEFVEFYIVVGVGESFFMKEREGKRWLLIKTRINKEGGWITKKKRKEKKKKKGKDTVGVPQRNQHP